MTKKYLVVSVGRSRKTGNMQSACAPVIETNGNVFLGRERVYVDDALSVGQTVELNQSVVVPK